MSLYDEEEGEILRTAPGWAWEGGWIIVVLRASGDIFPSFQMSLEIYTGLKSL